jgi:hypothetical protein
MKAARFSLDRCSVVSPPVRHGATVAYYTEIGGAGKGRWVRAIVTGFIFRADGTVSHVHVLDEDGDTESLTRWESVSHRPPVLTPPVLREWLRAITWARYQEGAP